MTNKTLLVSFLVKLRKTTYDKKPPVIIKTHDFTGKTTTEKIAKNLRCISNVDNINTTMFSPYHIDLLNSESKTVFSSENEDFSFEFIDIFIEKYNNYENVENVNVLFDIIEFTVLRKNNCLICNFENNNYSRQEVQELLFKLLEIVDVQEKSLKKLNAELFINNIL